VRFVALRCVFGAVCAVVSSRSAPFVGPFLASPQQVLCQPGRGAPGGFGTGFAVAEMKKIINL